jgi:hypothetical protein
LGDDFVARGRCGFPDFLATFFVEDLAAFLAGAFAVFVGLFVDLAAGLPVFFTALLEAAFLAGAFLAAALTLPTTTRDPIDGKIVDSSPPDHVTRSRTPLTPVTTPSRGVWPTRFEGT